MRPTGALLAAVLVFSGVAATANADLVYPARLQIDESEPGAYDVIFSLPMVQGRFLRAEPMLPPSCTDVSTRETITSSTGRTSTWTVRCDPPSLAGEVIIVDGLFGSQTDLAFSLTTLDGEGF